MKACVETGQGSQSQCTSSKWHGQYPLPTSLFQKAARSTLLEFHFFLGTLDGERTPPASKVNFFEGKLYLHTRDCLYRLFSIRPSTAKGHSAQAMPPSSYCPGPRQRSPVSPPQAPPAPTAQPGPLPGTRRGSTQPSGQGWRENSLQLLSGSVFPSQADARTPSLCFPGSALLCEPPP